mmetsp:Transcript_30817/g.56074  ORF Transcript_30817/g.56074 Transcript_30817/m.56074 type:complete len:81 (+) Transcript_30817:718-960(+)
MEPSAAVFANLVVKTIRTPRLTEKDDRYRLAKAVKRKAASTHSIHDGGIVDYTNLHTLLPCSEEQIGMGRGTKRVSDDEE